ncbi:MAG TPA: hypothetical protein VNG32_00380 [Candidatus Dormibacteraeota bacterium]|nr:hypothetical protein [Candidatus Dormibacteraeota bacterium]
MSEIIREADSLQFASYNPRVMKEFDDAALGNSMDRLGDISGITYNTQTGTLVTGHQRMRKLKTKYGQRVKVYVEQKLSDPDESGTVGIGFVGVEGTTVRFAYREVAWDKGLEMAANYAANHIGGDDDKDLLAQVDYELSQMENGDDLLKLTGQTDKEIEKMLQSVGALDPEQTNSEEEPVDKPEKLEFALTRDQRLIIERAIETIKATRDLQAIETASLNGSALFVLAKDYIDAYENPTSQNIETPQTVSPVPGELTDIPASD